MLNRQGRRFCPHQKIRNVITGAVTERTFNPSDKYPTAYIERKDMEYLYSDGDLYYFMDQETYENIPNKSILSDNFKFVKENTVCQRSLSYKGESVFGIRSLLHGAGGHQDRSPALPAIPPPKAPATLETAQIRINEGDMIRVDTRTGCHGKSVNLILRLSLFYTHTIRGGYKNDCY